MAMTRVRRDEDEEYSQSQVEQGRRDYGYRRRHGSAAQEAAYKRLIVCADGTWLNSVQYTFFV